MPRWWGYIQRELYT